MREFLNIQLKNELQNKINSIDESIGNIKNRSLPEKDESVKSKIIVCFHKPFPESKADIYFPVQSGKENSRYDLDMPGDNSGDNISCKNSSYGELSIMYWIWKNFKKIYPNIENIGWGHYRRYLALDKTGENILVKKVPEIEDFEKIIEQDLKQNDFILQNPFKFPYTLKTQYEVCCHYQDWIVLKKVVGEMYPEYKDSFNKILEEENVLVACNLFVSKWVVFEKYCEWLFSILFEVEKRINVDNYSPYQKRALAFMSERLFTLYIFHNNFKVQYKPIYFIQEKPTLKKKWVEFFMPYGIIKK
jgi:hypothetical protein